MNPTHHLQEDLLLGHGCPHEHPAVALVVGTHAALCRECSEAIADVDAIAAAVLLGGDDTMAVSDSLRDKAIAAAAAAPVASPLGAGRASSRRVTPAAVLALRDQGDRAPWRWRAPGVREVRLGLDWNGVPASLVRLKAGMRIPRHTHAGRELTLVLEGGLGDAIGVYGPGDLADYDSSVSHDQFVLPDKDCVCLVVNESRLVPQTTIGRIFAWVAGA